MAEQHALIDWPLTPYTGWGSYGIQLAQALLEQGHYVPACLPSMTAASTVICIG